MKKNLHKGHRQRLRELASKNSIFNMQEHQVLELLLSYVIPQKDVNPTAHMLINKFGSFSEVLETSESELVKVDGIGEVTAHFLATFKDFFAFYQQKRVVENDKIINTSQAVKFISHYLQHKLTEEMYVVCIDGMNKVKKVELISKGETNETSADIRKITETIFKNKTHNVIICHNHPGGKANPSLQDDRVTKALLIALSINNINLLDHIIIGEDSYYSYASSGVLNAYKGEIQHLINPSALNVLMQDACEYNAE